ncbi:metal ABC transporter solute-binding protein, Zn/Mn family [Thiorhodovibrio winogradskyi]|nr:zinc ABC transporter substrate-binding protein [Thiorhodovibrio winogradskyi]
MKSDSVQPLRVGVGTNGPACRMISGHGRTRLVLSPLLPSGLMPGLMAALILILMAGLWPFQSLADPASRLRVFASVLPLQYLVQQVGGEQVQVEVMVLPGQSPATYEPRPRQVAALAQADLYVRVGVPFEDAWMRRIRAANPDMEILDARDGLTLRPMEAHRHGDDETRHHHHHPRAEEAGEHGGEFDAHVWTSPRLVRQMAERIRDRLSALDPDHAETYRANQQAFDQELAALDAELAEQLRDLEQRAFLVYHPAWGYFADAYDLRQIPVEFEGKEPSARQLARLIEQAETLGIRTVVVQPQFDQRAAERLARAINGRVASVDPLSVEYAANLRALAAVIAEGTQANPSANAGE